MKRQYWSYGLLVFCSAKRLNINEVVNAFIEKLQIEGDRNEAVENNWQKFSSFVNEGLLDGSINGRKVSVSNGSQERKQLNREEYSRVPEGLKTWWQYIKSKGYDYSTGIDWFLIKFFNAYGLGNSLPSKSDAEINILRNQSRYEVIEQAGLLDEFYLFDPKLMSDFKPNKNKFNKPLET